jgi:DUF1365 family protein
MGMDTHYVWRFTEPGEQLTVHMDNVGGVSKYFDATMTMRRREISAASLNAVLLRYPAMTLRVIAGIHWQALKLWLKRCPYHAHPKSIERGRNGAEAC